MFSATVYIYIFAQTDHKEDIPGIRDLFGNTNSIAVPAGYNIEFSRTRLEMNDSQLKEFGWYLWTRGCFMFKSNLFKYVALAKWAGNNRTFYEMRNPTWSSQTGRRDEENSWDGCIFHTTEIDIVSSGDHSPRHFKRIQRWMIFTMIKPQYLRFEGKFWRSWNEHETETCTAAEKLAEDWI